MTFGTFSISAGGVCVYKMNQVMQLEVRGKKSEHSTSLFIEQNC